jgi:acyl-CoA thioester hydrolase
MEIFTQPIRIEAADIDELGHVNNIVYLRWAQEIAVAHWRARASLEMQNTFLWVVTRHEVDYRAPLIPGDHVEARTWVAPEPHGASWGRHVEIVKAGAAKASASILSTWALMDAATRRVKRVPPEIVERFSGG